MSETLEQLMDESIKLERNVADVYKIFLTTFPEDSELWSKLIREEEKHADVIQSMRSSLLLLRQFPSGILTSSMKMLKKTNK